MSASASRVLDFQACGTCLLGNRSWGFVRAKKAFYQLSNIATLYNERILS